MAHQLWTLPGQADTPRALPAARTHDPCAALRRRRRRRRSPQAAFLSLPPSQVAGRAETPFTKLLAANRGEIAVRIVRAGLELGLKTVRVFSTPARRSPFAALPGSASMHPTHSTLPPAHVFLLRPFPPSRLPPVRPVQLAIYSQADRLSPHRFKADESYEVGAPGMTPVQAYLDFAGIVALAKAQGVDVIHPGYGFLSENAAFARECAAAGITFVGPRAETIEAMGDKTAARRLAVECGVPVVPGTDDAVSTSVQAKAFAAQAGYPVMIKARSGGGGRGMRVVREEAEMDELFQRASNEAAAAFGDGLMFVEKVRPCSRRPCRSSCPASQPPLALRGSLCFSPRCPVLPLPHARARSLWRTLATSRSRSWQTTTAAWCISTSATAPCSAATKRWWRWRPRRGWTPPSRRASSRTRSAWRATWATATRGPWR
jgi:hypothetical protein